MKISEEDVLVIPGKEYYLKGINENKRNNALTMLKDGKLSIDDISKYSGLSKEEVKSLKR